MPGYDGHFPEFLAARVDSSPVVGIVSLRTTPRRQIFGKGPLSSASNPQTVLHRLGGTKK